MEVFLVFLLLLVTVTKCVSEIFFYSDFELTELGNQFQPANTIELLATLTTSSIVQCSEACNVNIQCQTLDYDSFSGACRLFEGYMNTGSLIASIATSRVASIQLDSKFYASFNQPCSECIQNRYLTCSNTTCQCPAHFFWNGTTCNNQGFSGASCNDSQWCRTDQIGLICSVANTCANTTNPPATIIWSFDGNLNDQFNIYNGRPVINSSVIWVSPDYAFNGRAVYFSNNQYSVVPYSLVLNTTSFTLSAWIMIKTNLSINSSYFGLFGHCQSFSLNKCLHMLIKKGYLYLGFYLNDARGTTQLTADIWYHVAFVYSQSSAMQLVYLNGQLEGSNVSLSGYSGITNQVLVGAVLLGHGIDAFNGYIDEMIFVSRVKNASELLDEATLVAHYSFDNTLFDSGPNNLTNISSVNVLFDPVGRLNQALLINSTNSYFEVFGFYYLGQSNYSYSFSLWVYPFSISSGTILQMYSIGSSWCLPIIGFDNNSHFLAQTWDNNGVQYVLLNSSSSLLNTWTHIGITYSSMNGFLLYVNGSLMNTIGLYKTYMASGGINAITIGIGRNSSACAAGATQINPSQFHGKIDEFKVYSRELSGSEIASMMNP